MRAGHPVYIKASYLRLDEPDEVDGKLIEMAMVRLGDGRDPVRVPVAHIERTERNGFHLTSLDWQMDRTKFSKSVRRLRQSKNLSQADLGQKVGVSQRTIGMWEQGRMLPRMNRVAAIAAALGVSVSEIVEVSSGSLS